MSLYSHGQRLNDLEQRVTALEARPHLDLAKSLREAVSIGGQTPSPEMPRPGPIAPAIERANVPRYANITEFITATSDRALAAPRGYCTIRTYKIQVTSKPEGLGVLLLEADATSPEFMRALLAALNINTRVDLTPHD